jgi:DHA1 family multidrug resistance protein-like MFS transporter
MLAAGLAGLAILTMIPAHERRRPTQPPSKERIGRLITRRDVLLPSLAAAMLQYVNWAATLSFIPILIIKLGGTGVTQSTFVSMNIGVVVLGNLTAAVIVNQMGTRRLLFLSFGILSIGIGTAALTSSLLVLFVAQLLIGLAEGIAYPVLMGLSIKYVADIERTTAMGLHQAIYAIGTFAGPWLSGLIAEAIGLRPMFGVMALICLVVSLFITSRLIE